MSRCLRRVLIIRDFPNWLASRVRYHEVARAEFPSFSQIVRFAQLWTIYAREYLGETNFLRDVSLVTVSFNKWVRDDSYRCEVLESMGIKLKDNSTSYVPGAGGGSSFDATLLSGKAEQMQVFDRWKYLENRKLIEGIPEFHRQLGEINRLNNEIFGLEFAVGRF